MGVEEGRAFYWRTPVGSNDCFCSLHGHLASDPGCGNVPPSPFSPAPVPARMWGSMNAARDTIFPVTMTLEEIRALVQSDLESVNRVIRARLKSAVPLVDQIADHIIAGGGKRLRPLLVVLVGRACGHEGDAVVEAAAFIEFIHTATLLHDDVVDGSSMRRGRDTANEVFGNQASVLVGDFVYSRAFQMMAALTSQRV